MTNVHELAKRILKLLPGVDCGGYGGCGYPTCEACAKAIAEGGKTTLCPACDREAIAEIAEAMGVEPVDVEEKLAFIKCAGSAAGKERFKEAESCEAAKAAGFLKGECQWGCIGIGSCIDRCKFNAMKVEDGQVIIDSEKCTGCQACIGVCPQELISMIPKDATNFIPCSSKDNEADTLTACGYGCIGCGDCAIACPENAIEMIYDDKVDSRYADIDYDKCVGCVTCTVSCRKKIIVDTYHDLTKAKEEVAFVKCTGGAKGNRLLKDAGFESCKEVTLEDLNSNGICEYSCLGLGDCVKVCRYDAIINEYGLAQIDPDKCVGCGDCVRECPREKIVMDPYKGAKQIQCTSKASMEERLKVCQVGCIGCGDCADNCPNHAITMVDGSPVIDCQLCENCGICTYVCSRGLIVERQVPEYNYLQMEAMKINSRQSDERK
ncbi:MAG: 4Fe-4S binding protein [Clostridiales bacterium]|nr:4Fe-4S binding protein [Clostridiales bacterium]